MPNNAGSYRTGDYLPHPHNVAPPYAWDSKGDRPGTIEEKLDALAAAAAAQGEPFNRKKELRILRGAKRTPYVALNGEVFKTERAKDKRNKELLKSIGPEGNYGDLPWFASDPGPVDFGFTPPTQTARNDQTFEELWTEARQELESAHDAGPAGAKIAVLYYWVDKPSLFARIIKAVKEAVHA